jgi:7-cyano-7-deazaguanine synthase
MSEQKGSALVLHSGGIDSTVCLYQAWYDCANVIAMSIDYGQKHAKEIVASMKICELLAIPHITKSVNPSMFEGFGSTLIDRSLEQPHLSYQEIQESEGPSPTYVPQRNLNLLANASAFALVNGCDYIYFGPHADDAHNFAYPDCTPEFIGAISNAIYVGSYFKTQLKTPIMWMTKGQVVKLGSELNVPFELTWSCYDGGDLHCGECPTCVSRKEAFKYASLVDPTEYAS